MLRQLSGGGTLLNCSEAVRELLVELVNNTRPTPPPLSQEDRDRHAILYIVVVLLFYSIGIVIAIIMYLKVTLAQVLSTFFTLTLFTLF
jgi:hypothetical protein